MFPKPLSDHNWWKGQSSDSALEKHYIKGLTHVLVSSLNGFNYISKVTPTMSPPIQIHQRTLETSETHFQTVHEMLSQSAYIKLRNVLLHSLSNSTGFFFFPSRSLLCPGTEGGGRGSESTVYVSSKWACFPRLGPLYPCQACMWPYKDGELKNQPPYLPLPPSVSNLK